MEDENRETSSGEPRADDQDAIPLDLVFGERTSSIDQQDTCERVGGAHDCGTRRSREDLAFFEFAPFALANRARVAIANRFTLAPPFKPLANRGIRFECRERALEKRLILTVGREENLVDAQHTNGNRAALAPSGRLPALEPCVRELTRDLELAVGNDLARANPRNRERATEQREDRDPKEDLTLVGERDTLRHRPAILLCGLPFSSPRESACFDPAPMRRTFSMKMCSATSAIARGTRKTPRAR